MARRMGPEAAYEMAQRTMEENPGASRAEMRAKAERMVDKSRMSPFDRTRTFSARDMTPVSTPMTQEDARNMEVSRQKDFMDRTQRRMESNLGGFNIGYEQVAKDMGYDQTMTERKPPSAPASMQYDAAASAKLAELRGQSAFDVGFRQGLEDYQKMKGESPNIIDELSGSTEEANRARSAIFMGNMASTDIKRLGYAEAMEFAEREEKTGADKMLRQGMME
jgi:hypothetical protein